MSLGVGSWLSQGVGRCGAGLPSQQTAGCQFPANLLLPPPQDTLEKCNTCGQPITDRMLRATGKAYHPHCFTCVVCACALEGTSFIVDQANRPHCVPDYHK